MKTPDGPRFSIDPHPAENGGPEDNGGSADDVKWGWTIYHPNGNPSGNSPKFYYNRELAIKSVNHHIRNCLHLAASKIYGDPE